jgi:hypothetical protein
MREECFSKSEGRDYKTKGKPEAVASKVKLLKGVHS